MRFATDNTDEEVTVGRVDLVFRDDDSLVVVDYKTDRISADDLRGGCDVHVRQAQIYMRGVTNITGRRVSSVALIYARLGIDRAVGLSAFDGP